MPDKNRNSSGGGENSSKSSGKKQRPRNRNKQSNNGVKSSSDKTDGNSTTSSSRNPSKSSPEISNARKVEILKRDPKAPPLIPLMDIQTSKAPFQKNQDPASNGTTIETIKAQTRAYYFSENPGSAVSADTVTHQYTMQNFPLERNVNTMIDGKFSLMITPTTSRCNGLYIRVKSQNSEDAQYEKCGQSATGALVKLDSSEKTIRKACRETMENFYEVSTACRSKRHPFSKSSEAYLTSCFIKRLEERLETFPDAIYYCEKCDYHISTISHAKAHLESSTHFDDIKRQDQREQLLKHIPDPSANHLKSINTVLEAVLNEYKEVQQISQDQTAHILYYLNTSVFPTLGCNNVKLRPFGSATYDVVLPDSDFNVAYTMDQHDGVSIFSVLEQIRKKIADDGYPADHSMEMGTPSTIIFTFEGVRVRLCWMSCFVFRSQLHFSDLMKTYVDLRKEVVQFLQLIRIWAMRAGVDSKNKQRIGLPRYGFDIMAIHFLQRQQYLPILHELYDGEIEVEDPQTTKDEASSEVSKIPPEEAGQRRIRLMSRYEKDIEKIREKFNLTKKWNSADLFIKFFRYYVKQNREIVIQITQSEAMSRDANRWNKKILHVVDPFRGDNVLSIPKVSTWQPFYFNCLLTTFLAFAIPRTENGPLVEVGLLHNKTTSSKKKVKEPQTPKRNHVEVPPQTPDVFKTPKVIAQITEEEYQAAADELAEEQDEEEIMKQKLSRLEIDGIKFKSRKPGDCEIDDHFQLVYSKKSLTRFKRVLPRRLNETMVESLTSHKLMSEKGDRRVNSWRKSVAEVTEKMEKSLKIKEEPVEDLGKIPQSNDVPFEVKQEIPFDAENQVSEVPKVTPNVQEPETANVFSINCVITQPQQIQADAVETPDESLKALENAREEAEKFPEPVQEIETTPVHFVNCVIARPIPEAVETPEESSLKASENAPEETGAVPKLETSDEPLKALDNDTENAKDVPKLESLENDPESTPKKEKDAPTKRDSSFDESPRQEPPAVPKPSSTFGSLKIAPLIEKQICCEEFFIKENVDFKGLSKAKTLKQTDFRFEFTSECFSGGYEMEMKCTHCDGSHCVENCPMMEIPPIKKFEARTKEDLADIDLVINEYYKNNIVDKNRLVAMEKKKDELQTVLRQNYREDITLTLFGSVMTGLSASLSDIDICLRFGDDEIPPKDISPKDVILETEKALRRANGFVRKVQAIVTAKVPIVKFQIRLGYNQYMDADISYYNVLAIHNTALLREYTLWTPDNRFAKLALFIKAWAKSCDIGDASRGSLSSYAHIIMLISYLQNCDPPVLPRLQEDFRSDNREKRMVENWDTSYAQVEEALLKSWPKNKESCAQLLIGYFDYYSRFDFRNFVVQCRREMTLSKMEKEWPRPICVEDPFDLNHNLSSGVTKKMFVFIMKVFINSRAVFMSEKPKMTDHNHAGFHLMYRKVLLDKCHQGSAPSDRQCHSCHRIGHFYESCPFRMQGKDNRRRYTSNSTNNSYRSNDGFNNHRKTSEDSNGVGDRLGYHKRAYGQRPYK
ncbi:hypothetical protein L5515_005042 [Caenorhabditis briggsae]|uniref:4Fe-4S ferredoxin-type domain-containing protein n=1 Tax=Caenorhabditis briggsae TaxID=6238 RepID=A0AAE9EN46_CAEBR|nr:hypothetical protein L5515_005042 [Caenorhabditis briggsae]